MIDLLAAAILGGLAALAILIGLGMWLFHWLWDIPED